MSDNALNRFEPIKAPSAYEMVAEAIEREITSGRLKPGDEIGTEAELVRQFGVNRSTVREGIRVLEQSGLVRREAARKLFVCTPHYRYLSSRMSRALIISEVTFRELYETAMVLELGAIEGAVAAATDEDLAALEDNQRQAEAAVDDPMRLAEVDTDFHALIAHASHNRVLELAREPAALLFFPTSEMICRKVSEGARRMVDAHRELIDSIRARDVERARLWMARHVTDWKKGFERTGRSIDEPVERGFDQEMVARLFR
ncbi:MAG: FadR family transcriptional regulator [Aquamicrobium sp.]|nr:FadR family transcriptional regulator [Aquamicrobium sp.]